MAIATVVVQLGRREAPRVHDGGCDWSLEVFRARSMARFALHACFRPVDGAICAERYRAGRVAAKTTERGARRIERPVPPPARVLMTVSPPGHEHYFEELAELAAQGRAPDPKAIGELRARFDTDQLSALTAS